MVAPLFGFRIPEGLFPIPFAHPSLSKPPILGLPNRLRMKPDLSMEMEGTAGTGVDMFIQTGPSLVDQPGSDTGIGIQANPPPTPGYQVKKYVQQTGPTIEMNAPVSPQKRTHFMAKQDPTFPKAASMNLEAQISPTARAFSSHWLLDPWGKDTMDVTQTRRTSDFPSWGFVVFAG